MDKFGKNPARGVLFVEPVDTCVYVLVVVMAHAAPPGMWDRRGLLVPAHVSNPIEDGSEAAASNACAKISASWCVGRYVSRRVSPHVVVSNVICMSWS